MSPGKVVFFAILTLASVFALATGWEFVLEPIWDGVVALPDHPESLAAKWENVVTSLCFTALALIVPGMLAIRLNRRRQAELRALEAAVLESAAGSLAKHEFLSLVSHELRTPLNSVIGFSDMMVDQSLGPLPAPYDEYARHVNESGRQLLQLISAILDLSQIETGKLPLTGERIEIEELCEDCLRDMAGQANFTSVRFQFARPPALPALWADRRRVRQILINLLSNAAKFSPPGGCVELSAAREKGCVVLRVSDQGPGIPSDALDRLMEPFITGDASLARRHGGIGIGLPLSRMLIERHGGHLELKGAPGLGTTASVVFPAGRTLP